MDNTRDRAWRRAQARTNKSRDQLNARLVDCYAPEKTGSKCMGAVKK